MSTNQTERYNLHLWEPGDNFLRAEFNENFEAVDAALGGKIGAVFGSYVGDNTREQKIELGFTPAAVFVIEEHGRLTNGNDVYGGLALPGLPVVARRESLPVVTVTEGGFLVYYEYSNYGVVGSNIGVNYYIAFRET